MLDLHDGYQIRSAENDDEDLEGLRIIGNGLYDYGLDELAKCKTRDDLANQFYLRCGKRPGETSLVTKDGEIVGVTRITPDPEKNRDPETDSIKHWSITAILPGHRGKGLSTPLREYALARTAADNVYSRVDRDNHKSWSIAEKLGYTLSSDDGKERIYRLAIPAQRKVAAAAYIEDVGKDRSHLPFRKRVEVIAVAGDKALCGTFPDGGVGFFGGGVDDGEDVLAAAQREFLEETGHDLSDAKPSGTPVQVIWTMPDNADDKFRKRFNKYQGSETHYVVAKLGKKQQDVADGEDGQNKLQDIKLRALNEIKSLMRPDNDQDQGRLEAVTEALAPAAGMAKAMITQKKVARWMKLAFDVSDSASTAISRANPSAPASVLADLGALTGKRVLHAGAGRENNPDRALLDQLASEAVHYDPNHGPAGRESIGRGDFDTVYSPYVLNVLPPDERKAAIQDILSSMKPDGEAYIAVRSKRDVGDDKEGWEKHEDGYIVPGRGSFQRGFSAEELQELLGSSFDTVEPVPGARGHSTLMRVAQPKGVRKVASRTPGKRTRGATYTHRAYATDLPGDLPDDAQGFNIVKTTKDGKTKLIYSPDFDTADEPMVEWSYDPETGKKRKVNQLYHHKWEMVGDDYKGFDVDAAKARSELINKHIKPEERSTMGQPDKWAQIVKRFTKAAGDSTMTIMLPNFIRDMRKAADFDSPRTLDIDKDAARTNPDVDDTEDELVIKQGADKIDYEERPFRREKAIRSKNPRTFSTQNQPTPEDEAGQLIRTLSEVESKARGGRLGDDIQEKFANSRWSTAIRNRRPPTPPTPPKVEDTSPIAAKEDAEAEARQTGLPLNGPDQLKSAACQAKEYITKRKKARKDRKKHAARYISEDGVKKAIAAAMVAGAQKRAALVKEAGVLGWMDDHPAAARAIVGGTVGGLAGYLGRPMNELTFTPSQRREMAAYGIDTKQLEKESNMSPLTQALLFGTLGAGLGAGGGELGKYLAYKKHQEQAPLMGMGN